MLRDKAKKEYQRDYMKRKRSNKGSNKTDGSNIMGLTYPNILDKLTDSAWRPKLEMICSSFQNSHHSSYSKACWLGDINLSVVCDLVECTS